jgi:ribosomal protein S18 acetylase RimI-like enzyme
VPIQAKSAPMSPHSRRAAGSPIIPALAGAAQPSRPGVTGPSPILPGRAPGLSSVQPSSVGASDYVPIAISPPAKVGSDSYRIVAGVGGRPIGSVMVHARGSASIEVTDLKVDASHRGQNLGGVLMASALRAGQQLGRSRAVLASRDDGSGRLTRWYERMGFEQAGVNALGYPKLQAPIGRVLANVGQARMAPTVVQRVTSGGRAVGGAILPAGSGFARRGTDGAILPAGRALQPKIPNPVSSGVLQRMETSPQEAAAYSSRMNDPSTPLLGAGPGGRRAARGRRGMNNPSAPPPGGGTETVGDVATLFSSLPDFGAVSDFMSSAAGVAADVAGPLADAVRSLNGLGNALEDWYEGTGKELLEWLGPTTLGVGVLQGGKSVYKLYTKGSSWKRWLKLAQSVATALSGLASILVVHLGEHVEVFTALGMGLVGFAEALAIPAEFMKVKKSWRKMREESGGISAIVTLCEDITKLLGSVLVVAGAIANVIPGGQAVGPWLLMIGLGLKLSATVVQLVHRVYTGVTFTSGPYDARIPTSGPMAGPRPKQRIRYAGAPMWAGTDEGGTEEGT